MPRNQNFAFAEALSPSAYFVFVLDAIGKIFKGTQSKLLGMRFGFKRFFRS